MTPNLKKTLVFSRKYLIVTTLRILFCNVTKVEQSPSVQSGACSKCFYLPLTQALSRESEKPSEFAHKWFQVKTIHAQWQTHSALLYSILHVTNTRNDHLRTCSKDLIGTGNVHLLQCQSAFFLPFIAVQKINKYYIFWVCVSSLRYPACNAHEPYWHVSSFWLYIIFPLFFIDGTLFERK